MRFCVPGPGSFVAGLLCFFLIIDVCSADAHESLPKASIAALESSLKAKIPATVAQATQDYSAARSIFDRCFVFVFVFVFEPRLRFLMSQPRNPIFIYALLIIKLSERQNIDLKALSYIPRDMKCGAKPCSVPNRSCTRCLLRYRYPLHSVLEIYPSHPSRQANVLTYLLSGPGCGISSRCARLEHSHELGAPNRSHRNKSHPPPEFKALVGHFG